MSGNSTSVERSGRDAEWTPVAVPGGTTPFDAAGTAAGAYAVGTGGVVAERTDGGWRTVLDGVPGRAGVDLCAADATDDGRVLWLVGDGVVCEYDALRGVVNRHPPPRRTAAPLVDVAATGDATAATVAVVTADGRAFRSTGCAFEGWRALVPHDAGPVRAVAADGGVVAARTADGVVSATGDGPARRLGDADFAAGVGGIAVADGDVWATDLDGSVHRWDGSRWRGAAVAEGPLRDVAVTDDGVVAVGKGGAAFVRDDGRWECRPTPAAADLFAVASTRAGGPPSDGAPSAVALGPDRTLLER